MEHARWKRQPKCRDLAILHGAAVMLDSRSRRGSDKVQTPGRGLVLRDGRGEAERESRPFANSALNANLSTVGDDDLTHDRQTEPGPALLLCARSPEKLVEHPGNELRRDAFASVRDGELHRAPVRRSSQDDRTTTFRVP